MSPFPLLVRYIAESLNCTIETAILTKMAMCHGLICLRAITVFICFYISLHSAISNLSMRINEVHVSTSFSSSKKRMLTSLTTEDFSLARSFTLSKRYLVSDFSPMLWYAVSVGFEAHIRHEHSCNRSCIDTVSLCLSKV